MAPKAQWWLVMINPSGDTNDDEHPPSHGVAEARPVLVLGSQICSGVSCSPIALSVGASSGTWLRSHIPSSARAGAARARRSATRATTGRARFMGGPPFGSRERDGGL